MKWLPIESAPKDGTDVIVFGVAIREINGADKHPDVYTASSNGGAFYCNGSDYYSVWVEPTHWMPLPQPPEE